MKMPNKKKRKINNNARAELDSDRKKGLPPADKRKETTKLCMLMLNFILAIIVDSYAGIKELVVECVVENNVVSDVVSLLFYEVYGRFYHGWPAQRKSG